MISKGSVRVSLDGGNHAFSPSADSGGSPPKVEPAISHPRAAERTNTGPHKYRTIVADPPWDHSDGTGLSLAAGGGLVAGQDWSGMAATTKVPYSCLSVEQIAALRVRDLAEQDAHLYLWTTNRYLHAAYHVAEAWGFKVSKPLVWCKAPKGFMGKPFVSSAEFVLFCRRGSLKTLGYEGRQWWEWKRGAHSQKPEAFLDIVEQVSPGPYLELFARRNRLGWDTWGNEAIEHIEIAT